VLEFQKANGLQADGLVGDETMAALQPRPPNDDRFVAQLSQLAAQAGQGLTGVGANAFVRHQRALLAPFAPTAQDRSGVVDSPAIASLAIPFQIVFQFTPQGQAFLLLMLLMMLIVALMLSSNNPALRQRGRFWEKEVERAPVRPGGRLPQRPSSRLESISTARPRALKSARASTWLHLRRVPRPLPK
jgi:hypothetical protein